MRNFSIHFSYPWLLLLLIPAVALTLIPYFRLSKRYRRTRNRIVSMVLHLCVTVLCISILSGIEFRYTKTNTENEIILLVDVSDTEERAKKERDEFIQTVLDDGRYDGYKIGVVTFGFTQNYAVELTYDIDEIYDRYVEAPLPDTSATDIASALKFTKDLFTHPESSKVVLITDGKETDGNALGAIRSLTAQGTIVDSAYISKDFSGDDVQVTQIKYPETHVKPDTECSITVTVRSLSQTASTRIELTDNGERTMGDADVKTLALARGDNEVSFNHTFTSSGLHEMKVTLFEATDALKANDVYTSYVFLDDYNHILIVERNGEESQNLIALLRENSYEIDRVNLSAATDVPTTEKGVVLQSVNDFRNYDQIIMNNIADKDMKPHKGFVDMLYSYVHDYGGGLFTVGGDDETGKANAYSRADLYNTKYQEMLPVQAIEYTPPVGVMVLVDRSGSMTENLEYARQGLISCANALTERDYIGVMTLDTVPRVILELTPRTHTNEIMEAFEDRDLKEAGGGTHFFESIHRAGVALQANKQVEKRHIIIVSDGMPNDKSSEEGTESTYITEARALKAKGITLSVVLISEPPADYKEDMEDLVKAGGGTLTTKSGEALVTAMREELRSVAVAETEEKAFSPIVKSPMSAIFNGVQYGINQAEGEESEDERDRFRMSVKLGGFYGVKKKDGAETLLTGNYDVAPLYAQWKFGKGTVGSFMCDLTGKPKVGEKESWSAEFLADANARKLICNIVDNLMPTTDISPTAFDCRLEEENYANTLKVYADLKDGEYIDAKIILTGDTEEKSYSLNTVSSEGDIYVTTALDKANRYSRCAFVVKRAGVYKIILTVCAADGTAIPSQTVELYKSFAFSKEYDLFAANEEETTAEELLSLVAKNGNGSKIADLSDPVEVFDDFITGIDKTFDPRYVFVILAIILFLLDVAVRKFKFKWIHEIIREKKRKSAEKKND